MIYIIYHVQNTTCNFSVSSLRKIWQPASWIAYYWMSILSTNRRGITAHIHYTLNVVNIYTICILHGIILGVACFKQHCSSHTISPCFYFFAMFHQTGINTNTLVQMRLYYCQQNHTNSPAQTNITPPNLNPTPSTPNQNMQVYIFTALCTILLWVNLRFDK